MKSETVYTPLPVSDEDLNGDPKAEANATTGIPVLQETGFPTVQEVFHPAVVLAWDEMRLLMKLWLAVSILTLPIGGLIFYGSFGSILGTVGASIYLCKCCQGIVPGVTRNRISNLKVMSLIATILSTFFGVFSSLETIAVMSAGGPEIVLIAAISIFRMGHAFVSLAVFKRVQAINRAMNIDPNAVLGMP